MNKDIEIAVDSFRRLAGKYGRPERYYKGGHDLSFATEKFQNAFGSLFREFAMNLCPAIVDAVKDKMRVNGFRVDGVVSSQQSVVRRGKQENSSHRPPVTEAVPPLVLAWQNSASVPVGPEPI